MSRRPVSRWRTRSSPSWWRTTTSDWQKRSPVSWQIRHAEPSWGRPGGATSSATSRGSARRQTLRQSWAPPRRSDEAARVHGRADWLRWRRQDHGGPRAGAGDRPARPLPLHGRQRRLEQPPAADDAARARRHARASSARAADRRRSPCAQGDPLVAAPGQPGRRGVVPAADRRDQHAPRPDRRLRPPLHSRLSRVRCGGGGPDAQPARARLPTPARLSETGPRDLSRRPARGPIRAQGRGHRRVACATERRVPPARRRPRALCDRGGDPAGRRRRFARGRDHPGGGSTAVSAPTVLVTDAGRGSAIAVIRSLGRQGLHVIAADHDRRSAGFRSRYAAERLVYPDPATEPAAVVELLHRQAGARHVELIVPVTDELLLPLAAARARFEGVSALAIPDDDALSLVTNKWATIELAQRLGVPVPRTVLVQSADEALAAASDLGWPLVLKPAASRMLRGTRIERFEVSYADGPVALTTGMLP